MSMSKALYLCSCMFIVGSELSAHEDPKKHPKPNEVSKPKAIEKPAPKPLPKPALTTGTVQKADPKTPPKPSGVTSPGSPDKATADAAASQNKCGSLAKLDQDTATLDMDVDALALRMDTLSHRLDKAAKVLAIPSDLAKDLKKIEELMTVVQKGARIAEAVPDVRPEAKKVNDAITPALARVKTARAQAEALATKIEPIRQTTQKMANDSEKVSVGLNGFSKGVLKPMPNATRSAQFCIVHFEPPTRTCIQGKVDDLAGRLDTVVREMDKVVKLLLTDYSLNGPSLSHLLAFSDQLEALAKVRKEAEMLEKRLLEMSRSLRELESLLEGSYSVKIPYLVGHYTVHIKMSHIIKGAKAVEDAIQDAVSNAVWDAAKAFGVGKLVKEVMKDASHDLNQVLSKLHLNPDMNIPGLEQLGTWMPQVDALLKDFPGDLRMPQFDLKAPDFGWPHVPIGVDFRNINLLALQLSPLGFKWDLPKLQLNPPTFGCK